MGERFWHKVLEEQIECREDVLHAGYRLRMLGEYHENVSPYGLKLCSVLSMNCPIPEM